MTGTHWSDEAPADPHAPVDRGSISLEQSGLKQYGGLAAGLVGGIAFLFVGVAFASESAIALVGFGFFGVFLLVGSLASLRRGGDRRLIEVGPDGIWLPEMGVLAWPAIREVRLETVRGVGGGGDSIVPYRRLGVVPLDPDHKPNAATRLGWGMFQGYARFLKSLAPGVRFGADDLAPFGLAEPEATAAQVDAALSVVEEYVDVVDAASERARDRAPRWAARAPAAARGQPLDIAALDAGLGVVGTARGASAPLVAAVSPATPQGVFRAPPLSPKLVYRWLLGLLPLAAFAVFFITVFQGPPNSPMLGVFLVLGLVMVGLVVARVGPPAVEAIRRSRLSDEERTVLRVGPDGIWLPGMGLVAWDRIRGVVAKVKGTTVIGAGGQIPRWGLFVQPDPRSAPSGEWAVYADQLDAPFDDVVDLVRFYHPVDELG